MGAHARPPPHARPARDLRHDRRRSSTISALEEIRDLPGIEELKGAGLLSARMPANFSMPLPPSDPDELTEDEDPLTDIDLEELGLLTPRVTED